jgi:hypothetical protein
MRRGLNRRERAIVAFAVAAMRAGQLLAYLRERGAGFSHWADSAAGITSEAK